MKITRALMITIGIWILGVVVFSMSYLYPFMNDVELQANLFLAAALIPLSWFGAHLYYQKDRKTSGLKLGSVMVLITITLDALFTVPFFIIPEGGTYTSFFIDLGFWLLIVAYLGTVMLYQRTRITPSH